MDDVKRKKKFCPTYKHLYWDDISEHDGAGRAGGCNVWANVHGQRRRRRNYKPVAGHQSRWTLFFSETHPNQN